MAKNNESECKYVCSRGILKSCDIYSNIPHSSVKFLYGYDTDFINKIKTGNTVYVCNSAIPAFCQIVNEIQVPFILVSGDCDECCWQDLFETPNDFLLFMANPKLIHWFSQNCICLDHPKLSQIPIGLDYHTMVARDSGWGLKASPLEQELELQTIVSKYSKPWSERLFKTCAYSNFHFSMETRFAGDRHDAKNKIQSDCVYYEPTSIKRVDTWKTQTDYVFIVSPFGGGLDCHRTWEALVLGCIPIVKTSPLDALFRDLPVWIVNDWSEVTVMNMYNVMVLFQNQKFNLEKLRLDYWVNIIRSKRAFFLESRAK